MTAPRGASAAWRKAARALAGDALLVAGVEITHPALPAPFRAVRDVRPWTIDGAQWPPVAFDPALASDQDGRPPTGQIAVDNVGHVATEWVERANAAGLDRAALRIVGIRIDASDPPAAVIEWEQRYGVRSIAIPAPGQRIVAQIGVQMQGGRPAVVARHDPARSPGLF